jgi:ribonucleotide monophosphatase NagD (HAD superfamily)
MDIECARQAGVRSVLVKTGNAGRDGRFDAIPTKIHPDLASAVGDILSEYETSIQPG